MRLRAKILRSGKTAAGIEVPSRVVAALGSKRPPVRATINGFTYRTSVASMGGKFMLGVPPEFREGAGVAAGDTVDVDLELDTQPREVAIPLDFAAALGSNADAKRSFEGLTYSNKRRLVIAIEAIKSPETRQRRIAKTIDQLKDGRA
ncbi:MAG: YdeI/OmpD-associated family protein [Candidatus Dormibacteraceae bacterium]